MTPFGTHNPPPVIDPADYPHRVALLGTNPDGDVVLLWFDRDPLPLADDVTEAVQNVMRRGGGVLMMARDQDTLARSQAAILLLVGMVEGRA